MLDFGEVYAQTGSTLVKLQMLRTIAAFRTSRDTVSQLIRELDHAGIPLVLGLMEALALTGQTQALLRFHNRNRRRFAGDPVLAAQFARCCRLLCESAPQPQLQALYRHHHQATVRFVVIEALAAGGGPRCKAALEQILQQEPNPSLRGFARLAYDATEVTRPGAATLMD